MPITPVPNVVTFVDATIVHQVDLNTIPANQVNLYNYTLGGFRTNKPLAAVRATTQTIPNLTDTLLIWDTKDIDYDGMWSSSAPTQLTVNTPGIYRIYLQAGHSGALGNPTSVYICVNGTSTQNNAVGTMVPNSGLLATCSATVSLSIGSTIYGFTYQSTGASKTVRTVYGGCRLTAEWVSPQ